MLTVHRGNRLERLAECLAELLAGGPDDPLAERPVVVDRGALARWLALRLAERDGVCAGVRFVLPATLAWEIARALLGELAPAEGFTPEALAWRIAALLEDPPGGAQAAALRAYLERVAASPARAGEGGERERHALAARLAALYDRYLVYRPDWLRDWQAGRGEPHWQGELWRALVAAAGADHWAAVQARLLAALERAGPPPGVLPGRLCVLLGAPLSPCYSELLAALGRHCDLHLLVPDPCAEYWGDLCSPREAARRQSAGGGEELHLEVGNPLLASLGAPARAFLDQLLELAGDDREHFEAPAEDCALGVVQADLLALRDPRGEPPVVLAAGDDSLQVHACHGPVREVEVLRDRLLALFEAEPGLDPGEVLIAAPDITRYAPFLDAVLAAGEPRIPVALREAAPRPLAEALLALLDTAAGRLELDGVLDLLARPALRRRFGLGEGELEQVGEALRRAGVRWGRDAEARARLGLPAVAEHSWRFGLDRLLLGHALEAAEETFAGAAPLDGLLEAGILGELARFAEGLCRLGERLAEPRPVAAWCALLHETAAEFLALDDPELEDPAGLAGAIEALARAARAGGYAGPVGFAVIRERLAAALAPGALGPALVGAVNCCSMTAARAIPFAVICLLGLDDGVFPRAERDPGLDLSAARPRRGDRSLRDDDRQLLLDALLAARRCLYLSYTGADVHDDSPIPPSPVLGELLDYLDARFRGPGGAPGSQALLVRHPLQPFSSRYFTGQPGLFSYSAALAEASRAGAGRRREPRFFAAPLAAPEPPPEPLALEELIEFWCHPARALLRGRLGVALEEGGVEAPASEPFLLDGLERWALDQRLLGRRLAGLDPDADLALMRAEGRLPHGEMGQATLAEERARVGPFAARVEAEGGARRAARALAAELAGVRIEGVLEGLGADGCFAWRLGRRRARDRLAVWIRHLLLCLAAPEGVAPRSRWLDLDGLWELAPVAGAGALLEGLVAGWRAGRCAPLAFLPESSQAAAAALAAGRDPLGAARRRWEGSERHPGEQSDPYNALAWRGRDPLAEPGFVELAAEVFAPLEEQR